MKNLSKQALQAAKKAGIDFSKVDFTKEEFIQGFKVELEHDKDPETDVVNSPVQVAKIAWVHLKESPKYYTALAKMEKQFEESLMKLRENKIKLKPHEALSKTKDKKRKGKLKGYLITGHDAYLFPDENLIRVFRPGTTTSEPDNFIVGESEMKLGDILEAQRNMPKGVKNRSGKSRPYFDQGDQGPQWGGGSEWEDSESGEWYDELKSATNLQWQNGDLVDTDTGEVFWINKDNSRNKKRFLTTDVNRFKKILKQYKIKTRG